jgi:predicted nucleotide-binding protein (sugar kinase/HSP70/actin superfamily)
MKIGIPRGLSYYNIYPFLYGFFSAIGIEVILSDKTTKKTLTSGSALVVTETCLPVKIFVGHVLNLIEKGVEKILVPSLQSFIPKIYNCSKIRGLPDLIRNVVKQDFQMIEPTLDKSENGKGLYSFLQECVSPFGIFDMERIKNASKAGWKVYNNFQVMLKSGMSYDNALKNAIKGKLTIEKDETEYPISVALVSHGYNIYDERASMKVIDKLNKMGVKVYTAYQLTDEQLEEGVSSLGQQIYWANETEMTGCAGHYLRDNKIDGLITITAFGCGPDSLMIERITRRSKQFKKPLLNLTIDEHTGEAGFITRLEAFVDMLYRKKRKQGIIDKGYAPTSNVMDFI